MKIACLGCGTWGTALALLLVQNGHDVCAWDINKDLIDILIKKRVHPKLASREIPKSVRYVYSLEEALEGAECIVESVTSGGIRPVFTKLHQLGIDLPLIITSKGLEQKTGLLFPEVAVEIFGEKKKDKIGCISGPSHAEEVIKNIPTSVVASSYSSDFMLSIVDIFNSNYFRVYPNSDIYGITFSGAMKNIIAIACGISDGIGYGDNTKAALITRGLHEMRKLVPVKGGDPQTLNGLAGVGDLIVTCASPLSRNYRFGKLLGEGKSVEEAKTSIGMVIEGIYSCISAYQLGQKYQIPIPITEATYGIIYGNMHPKEAVRALLSREIKEEHL
ncbi:MAG: NAD(P)-dependent glycerol-3-phosphate dehydrogenase [Parachlamydiales bacterium]|nr:NAD(P)-dependent glycerol-3-phosphate dehydrogenase [Parachlamydiales bacterium]